MDRLNRAAQIGIGCVGLGFLLLFIAWNGAAGQDCPECQIPYLLSGGAAGLGLIVVGAALLLFESARRDRAHLERKFQELKEVLANGTVASTNGHGVTRPASAAASTGPVRPVADPNVVVVGKSSFHAPTCRLVEGKEDLEYATRAEAAERGLVPCRVCEPVTAPARRKR